MSEQSGPGPGWRVIEVGDFFQKGDRLFDNGWREIAEAAVGYAVAMPKTFWRRADEAEQPDLVNAPPHYRQGEIECIDAIQAALTDEEFRGFIKGNAIKYCWREKHKGGDQDLAKAKWYLDRLSKEQP